MTLRVHTARISYAGVDRLDITRKSAKADGIAFAPSWIILNPTLTLLRNTVAIHNGDDGEAQCRAVILAGAAWDLYREAYTLEMRESYRRHRPVWDALLARERVVLVCYCTDARRCHRSVLAEILAKLGAINEGELP